MDISIKLKIESLMDTFSNSEKLIGKYILKNLDEVKGLTSKELGERAGAGQSSVIKFVKKIGFKGFTEFKIKATEELERKNIDRRDKKIYAHENIGLDDSLEETADKLASNSMIAIKSTLENLNLKDVDRCIDLISHSGRIHLIGLGASSLVAKDFYYKLRKLGISVFHDLDYHIQLSSLSNLDKEDLIIVISNSAEARELAVALEEGSIMGAKSILITNFSSRRLREMATISLETVVYEELSRSSAISSRIAQSFVIDLLFMGLIKKDGNKALESIEGSSRIIKKLRR